MRGAFRTLGAGLSGLIAVLGAIAWLLNALSSMAAEPPRGMGLGSAGDRSEPDLIPVSIPVAAGSPSRSWRFLMFIRPANRTCASLPNCA